MAYAFRGAGALDYLPCQYGTSRLIFRGPQCDLKADYLACLGGTMTYGKFIPFPYPSLLEEALDIQVVNLGCVNAGPEVFFQERELTAIASGAKACVVQITGAGNQTNKYYSVHPRRNDRFVAASPLLRALYGSVDFTEISFTRHLLATLQAHSPQSFEVVAQALREAWVVRMKDLLRRLTCPTILLWVAETPPPASGRQAQILNDPILIDQDMITAIRPLASAYVELIPSAEARREGVEGMAFGPMEAPAAATLPGPAVHYETATLLLPVISQLI